jgi:hypothetical protein
VLRFSLITFINALIMHQAIWLIKFQLKQKEFELITILTFNPSQEIPSVDFKPFSMS